MACRFTVGQKVVCVDDSQLPPTFVPVPLVIGEIYTIQSVVVSPAGGIGVKLANVDHENPWGFWHTRFRPVKTTKTDISIFREIVEREMKKDLIPMGVIR